MSKFDKPVIGYEYDINFQETLQQNNAGSRDRFTSSTVKQSETSKKDTEMPTLCKSKYAEKPMAPGLHLFSDSDESVEVQHLSREDVIGKLTKAKIFHGKMNTKKLQNK